MRTMRVRSATTWKVLAVVSLCCAPALAQRVDLKKVLPADTILYVGAPDLKASIREMQEMPLLKMWREPEVQDFVADGLKMLQAEWEKLLAKARKAHEAGQLPFDPDELLQLRVESLGLALTALDVTTETGQPMPKVGIMLHLDFGATAPRWRKVIDYLLTMAEMQSMGMLVREETKVGDVVLTSLVPPETDMSLNVAWVGNGVLFGTLQDQVESAVRRVSGSETASGVPLASSERFRKTFAGLDGQGPEVECYFQPGPLLDFALRIMKLASEEDPDFPVWLDVDGIGRAIEALGLRSIEAIGATSSYEGGKAVNRSYVLSPAPSRRGLFAGGSRPIDMGFLRWVPRDAASFSAGTFDLASVWHGIVGALKAYDENLAQRVLGMLSQYEQQVGVNVEQDLLASLGNEYVTWSMPMAAIGTTPEMAILLKVKDQDRLVKALQRVSELTRGVVELQESDRRGIHVYQILVNVGPMGGMGFNPLDMFIPTFSFKDGYLVAGFSTSDVKRVFARMDRADDPQGDVRSNAEFAPYLEQLPHEAVTSIRFTDWKANFEGIYQLVTSLVAFVPVDEDVPIDLSLLPDVSTLTQHLFGSVAWSRDDGNGWFSRSVGPWGPETVAVLGGALGTGVAVLWALRATRIVRIR